MPSHGDFIARGLSSLDRDSIDDWLAGEMAIARTALEDMFEEAFDSAPPWRFAWREEDGEGEGWTAGALAPSVDSVGRRFPVLLGYRGVAPLQTEGAAEQCEEAIFSAFSEGWDAERLVAAASAYTPADQTGILEECWWTADFDGQLADRLEGRRPPNLLLHMLTCCEGET